MPLGIGPLELIIVLAILIVIFGPKRLPGLGRSLGTGMREFKESVTGSGKDDEQRDELPAAPAATAGTPAAREPEVAAVEADAAPRQRDPSGSSA